MEFQTQKDDGLAPALIEREIRRLAPWYYRYDLQGISTDITEPCDPDGHREVRCPPIFEGFWQGKSVLDIACNEGAWSFSALDQGAGKVQAFDCRPINVEKARFVGKVLGYINAEFSVETCESWVAKHGAQGFDIVMMCGILYHLTHPQQTIRDYCSIAGEWIFVTSQLNGGEEDGFVTYKEEETIAASHEAEPSLAPNTANTLIREYAKHGFHPIHVEETAAGSLGGGCCLILRSDAAWPNCQHENAASVESKDVAIYLVPETVADAAARAKPFDLHVTVSNRQPVQRSIQLRLRLLDADGKVLSEGSDAVPLQAKAVQQGDLPSLSFHHSLQLDLAAAGTQARIEVDALEPSTGKVLGSGRMKVDLS